MKCNFLEKLLTITTILSLGSINTIQKIHTKESKNNDFFITTKGCYISQIIEELGANNGLCVHISTNIKDIFIGSLQEKSFEKLLDKFSKNYNLIWYKNSNDIYIYNIQELSRKTFILNFGDFNEFYNHLKDIKLISLPFTTIEPLGDMSFEVSGPPEWVSQVNKIVDTWNNQENDVYRKKENVYFFPLKYASAEDREVKYLDQVINIPGVATILNNIINSSTKKDGPNDSSNNESATTIIMADHRSNSIIIKDRNNCFESFSDLIKTLDTAISQIEISVSIIDIDTRFSYEVGSRLGISGDNFNITPKIKNSNLEFDNNYPINNKNSTLHFSANINDTLKFESELEALEINSGVKVLAQPSILTIDNQKAILEKSTTIYTKLIDEKTTKLEPITSGTLLEVTPRLISLSEEGNENKDAIFLQIHIKDGKIDSKTIKNIQTHPETNSSEIFTQAILKEGEGLLLGGFVREENSENELGIPYINRIPILNLLFGKKQHQNNKLIRLFYLKAIPLNLEKNILHSNNKINKRC